MNKKYAFIVPRFGRDIGGGAETLVRELATHLAQRGDDITILTTCARDNRSWDNELSVGESLEDGVRVLRFSVDPRNLEAWVPKQIAISEGMQLSIDDQLDWMAHSVNSQDLYAHIREQAQNYDALFFAPYLFGTTFWGSLIAPQRSVLISCLHDEHYAYLDIIAHMFRSVKGCLFNAAPEMELAQRLYGAIAGGEVGMGFVAHAPQYLASLEPYFSDKFPYLLYVGRKETGKNVHTLLDYFCALKEQRPDLSLLKLVILGGGSFSDLHRPEHSTRDDVIDLPHLSEQEKHRLIRYAKAVCQPSLNESFSIVLMESWLLGTPVLVHAGCAVTREHVIESGGGLYFADSEEFCATAGELCNRSDLRIALAQAGEKYVQSKYSWEAVLQRFDSVIEGLSIDDNSSVEALAQRA